MLNIELAEKVLTYIEAHPEKHDQASFINHCGTTACIAGHALLLSGGYTAVADDWLGGFDIVSTEDRERVIFVSDIAEQLLGLTYDQREALFFELQDEDEAVEYLRGLVAEAQESLSVPA